MITQNPWADGPAESLDHALELLADGSDSKRRLAMICVDNAVELMIKTFLGLPKRITGVQIPRKKRRQIFESFPALLDALEQHASEKLKGVDLGLIEWFHRLRNQLYHDGMGLTVEREKVEVYAELANALFKNLFGDPAIPKEKTGTRLLGRFVDAWGRLERGLISAASDHSLVGTQPRSAIDAARHLEGVDLVTPAETSALSELRRLRNQVIHGAVDHREVLTTEIVEQLESLAKQFDEESYILSRRDAV